MADTYEKDLAQKSSLTSSDFIRVVGSDNVSYKQGMSSVANLINNLSYEAKDFVIDGITFVFRRTGRVVSVVSGGTPTTAIPTDSYAGSVTVDTQYRPINQVVLYVTATNTANMQINLATDGTFRIGFASTAISGTAVRCNFTYITA